MDNASARLGKVRSGALEIRQLVGIPRNLSPATLEPVSCGETSRNAAHDLANDKSTGDNAATTVAQGGIASCNAHTGQGAKCYMRVEP